MKELDDYRLCASSQGVWVLFGKYLESLNVT